ncbi:unnamed protein product, partial [marine sediment metagenome]
ILFYINSRKLIYNIRFRVNIFEAKLILNPFKYCYYPFFHDSDYISVGDNNTSFKLLKEGF